MDLKFETHAAIERDIQELTFEVNERKLKSSESEREILRSAVGQKVYPAVQPQPQASNGTAGIPSNVLPDYLKSEAPALRLAVEQLIDVAIHKGIAVAARRAAKAPPFMLDAFHDALTDKLYDEFKRRNIIK